MKYIVKVAELQNWTTWYSVEAESRDEAEDLVLTGDADVVDESFGGVDDREILEIEPDYET